MADKGRYGPYVRKGTYSGRWKPKPSSLPSASTRPSTFFPAPAPRGNRQAGQPWPRSAPTRSAGAAVHRRKGWPVGSVCDRRDGQRVVAPRRHIESLPWNGPPNCWPTAVAAPRRKPPPAGARARGRATRKAAGATRKAAGTTRKAAGTTRKAATAQEGHSPGQENGGHGQENDGHGQENDGPGQENDGPRPRKRRPRPRKPHRRPRRGPRSKGPLPLQKAAPPSRATVPHFVLCLGLVRLLTSRHSSVLRAFEPSPKFPLAGHYSGRHGMPPSFPKRRGPVGFSPLLPVCLPSRHERSALGGERCLSFRRYSTVGPDWPCTSRPDWPNTSIAPGRRGHRRKRRRRPAPPR